MQNRTFVNNSSTNRVILKRKKFLDIQSYFSKTLQRDRKDSKKTNHLEITSSVMLQITFTRIINSDVTNFQNIWKNNILRVIISNQIFQNKVIKKSFIALQNSKYYF